jgi:hypothetical protein
LLDIAVLAQAFVDTHNEQTLHEEGIALKKALEKLHPN